MADSPTNRTHLLKSRMLSRRDLVTLCGTGTAGKAGGKEAKGGVWGLRAQHPPTAPGPGLRKWLTGNWQSRQTHVTFEKQLPSVVWGCVFRGRCDKIRKSDFTQTYHHACAFFQGRLLGRLSVYPNHDRAPTFSKITPVEFALRTSSVTHVRKTNRTKVKARLSP